MDHADHYNTWTLTNPVKQDVIIGVNAHNKRNFPKGCKTPDMREYTSYEVKVNGIT